MTMTDQSRKIAAFIAVLWIAAAAIAVCSLPIASGVGWLDFVLFLVMAALAERWYVNISKESGMSLSFTVHLASAVLFGPAFAIVVAVCGLAFTDGVIRRAPLVQTAFNMSQMAVSVGLCGLAYQALKVAGPVDLIADAPALALAALVYLVVNDSLVAGVVSLRGRSFLQEWRMSFRDILLPYASMAPLGALAAYSYQASPWSLLYFPPLLLVVHDGFKLFVSLQRETDHALVALADSIDRRDPYSRTTQFALPNAWRRPHAGWAWRRARSTSSWRRRGYTISARSPRTTACCSRTRRSARTSAS
jgi:hypothetical protein